MPHLKPVPSAQAKAWAKDVRARMETMGRRNVTCCSGVELVGILTPNIPVGMPLALALPGLL